MRQANMDPSSIMTAETLKTLGSVIKTNVAACKSVGVGFYPQLIRNFMDMLALYRAVSSAISEAVVQQGPVATRTPLIRYMRSIKKEILKLVQTYVEHAEDRQMVVRDLVPPLLDCILGDYSQTVASAREAEVLNVTATIIEQLKAGIEYKFTFRV